MSSVVQAEDWNGTSKQKNAIMMMNHQRHDSIDKVVLF